MDIQSLKVTFTEEDVNNLVVHHLADDQPVRDLAVRLSPEGVHVTGEYPVAGLFSVRFDTLWTLAVRGREMAACLAGLTVAGAPAGLVRGTLMEMLGASLRDEDAARVEGETLFVDPDRLLTRTGLSGHTNLTAVRCEAGRVILEGGTPGS